MRNRHKDCQSIPITYDQQQVAKHRTNEPPQESSDLDELEEPHVPNLYALHGFANRDCDTSPSCRKPRLFEPAD